LNLADLIPDADALIALEADELGLRMLPVLANWPTHYGPLVPESFLNVAIGAPQLPGQAPVPPGPYPRERRAALEEAIRSDLFGGAIGSYKNPHSHRNVA
jgi:hypothetical protein